MIHILLYKRLQLGLCGAVQCRCFRKIGPLRSASDDKRPTKMWDSIVRSPFLVYCGLVSNLVTMTNRQQKCVAHASKHMHIDADKTKRKQKIITNQHMRHSHLFCMAFSHTSDSIFSHADVTWVLQMLMKRLNLFLAAVWNKKDISNHPLHWWQKSL